MSGWPGSIFMRSFLRIDRAAITALLVIVFDQWTKWLAFRTTAPGEQLNVIPGFTISQTRNEGIAFGFFSGRPYLVLGLMAGALVVLLWFYRRHRDQPVLWFATGLLLGGALGNAIDRLALGYVRDFVNLPSFPSFNLADVSITFGVLILVLTIERQDARTRTDQASATDSAHASARQDDEQPD